MKTIIALAALVAAFAASPALAASQKHNQGDNSRLINGYTLEQWNAGAPSPGTDTD